MKYLAAVLLGALTLALVRGGCEYKRAEGWRDYAHSLERASQAAAVQTKAMREAEAKAYQEKARAADATHDANLDRVRAATADYVDAHRVQPARDSGPAQPISAPADAGQPADVPPGLVVVAEPDVQAASEWQAYGVTCHDYLLSITGGK
jgi:uncharacterized membrane protein